MDYLKVSQGMGAVTYDVNTREEFDGAFEKALKETQRPVVIDCHIDQDKKVWPMVSPGATLEETFDGEDLIEESKKKAKTYSESNEI